MALRQNTSIWRCVWRVSTTSHSPNADKIQIFNIRTSSDHRLPVYVPLPPLAYPRCPERTCCSLGKLPFSVGWPWLPARSEWPRNVVRPGSFPDNELRLLEWRKQNSLKRPLMEAGESGESGRAKKDIQTVVVAWMLFWKLGYKILLWIWQKADYGLHKLLSTLLLKAFIYNLGASNVSHESLREGCE